MADVAAGRVGAVYTYSADRLYRRLVDLGSASWTRSPPPVWQSIRSDPVTWTSTVQTGDPSRIMGTLAQRV